MAKDAKYQYFRDNYARTRVRVLLSNNKTCQLAKDKPNNIKELVKL